MKTQKTVTNKYLIVFLLFSVLIVIGCDRILGPDNDPTPTKADFVAEPTRVKVNEMVSFKNISVGENLSFLWNFGDGGFSEERDPFHQYTEAKKYTVILRAFGEAGNDKCEKTDYISVESVSGDFSANPNLGNTPLEVHFTNHVEGDNQTLQWDFGDGETSSDQHPVHVYRSPGCYTVKLRINNSNEVTKKDLITVSKLDADFYVESREGIALTSIDISNPEIRQDIKPKSIKFSDKSSGYISSWLWNFGDGSTSSLQNPEHFYPKAGKYTVTLLVKGPVEKFSIKTETEYISIDEFREFRYQRYPDSGQLNPSHTGVGDIEFEGHGPHIIADVTLDTDDYGGQVFLSIKMNAKETQKDWTEAYGEWPHCVLFTEKEIDPENIGLRIKNIISPKIAHYDETDHNWDYDFQKPNMLGEFWVMGDTHGDDIGLTQDDCHLIFKNIYFVTLIGK